MTHGSSYFLQEAIGGMFGTAVRHVVFHVLTLRPLHGLDG